MKNQTTKALCKIFCVAAILLNCNFLSLAQNWQLGGNPLTPLDATNNIIGPNAGANLSLKITTRGVNRLYISNNTNFGFVGVGRGFSDAALPFALMHIEETTNSRRMLFVNGKGSSNILAEFCRSENNLYI